MKWNSKLMIMADNCTRKIRLVSSTCLSVMQDESGEKNGKSERKKGMKALFRS